MIERRPGLDLLSHVILLIGVLIVAFPLYLTFVASTQTAEQISRSIPMSMMPGNNFWESYRLALFGGETSLGSKVPAVWPMMQTSLISALVISIGKITKVGKQLRVTVNAPKGSKVSLYRNGKLVGKGVKKFFMVPVSKVKKQNFTAVMSVAGAFVSSASVLLTVRSASAR